MPQKKSNTTTQKWVLRFAVSNPFIPLNSIVFSEFFAENARSLARVHFRSFDVRFTL